MSSKLFVGNLAWSINNDTLREFMTEAGPVVSAEVQQAPSGRSKGFALVEYESPEDAEKAVAELNDKELEGRAIIVREDRGPPAKSAPRDAPADRERRPRRQNQTPREPGTSIFVGNLPWRTSWQDLKDTFADYNPVYTAVPRHPDGRSKGFGIVQFESKENADKAIAEMNGTTVGDRTIEVREDRPNPRLAAE